MSNTTQTGLQTITKKGAPKTINIDAEDDTLITFINNVKTAAATSTATNTTISKDDSGTHIHNHYHYHHLASSVTDEHIASIYEHVEDIAEMLDGMRNLYGIIILGIIAYGVYQYGGHTFMLPFTN